MPGSDSEVHQLNKELMKEMRAQGERHANEIQKLAVKVEQNTEVVRQCMMNLVEVNSDRTNLTRCLMDMRTQLGTLTDESTLAKIKLAQLDTRWATVKAVIGINIATAGVIIAWLSLS